MEIISVNEIISFGEAGFPARQFTYSKKGAYPVAASGIYKPVRPVRISALQRHF